MSVLALAGCAPRPYPTAPASFINVETTPYVPKIYGIKDQATYTGPVDIFIEKPDDQIMSATMDGHAYPFDDSTLNEPGMHVLTVEAKSKANNQTVSLTIHFTLDYVRPISEVLQGVKDGATYTAPIVISFIAQVNVGYWTWIDGGIYIPGTPYYRAGTHTLDVMALQIAKNTSTRQTIQFTMQ